MNKRTVKITKNSILLLHIFMCFISCGKPNKNADYNNYPDALQIEVYLKDIVRTETYNYDNLYPSVQTIALETTDDLNSIIEGTQIKKVRVVDNKLFIQDLEKIVIFNLEGKYVGAINKRGRGHGEYLSLTTFDVNNNSKQIIIYDAFNHKLLFYNYAGNYIKQVEIPNTDLVRDFAVFPNGDMLFYTPDYNGKGIKRGLWQTDSTYTFKKQLVHIDDNNRFCSLTHNYLVHVNDTLISLMGEIDNNNLFYHITPDTITVSYKLKSDIVIPKRILGVDDYDIDKNPNKVYDKGGHYETDRVMICDILNNNIGFCTIITDKETKQSNRIYDGTDYAYTMQFVPPINFSDHNYLIGYYSSDIILKNPEFKETFYPDITAESNHIFYLTYHGNNTSAF